ncbi:MAG: tRNA lysidine(34) synthetase TilS [Salinibacterium sp.]|nr:tRNA lysidine(34) synthetase TilS [Salinibacterium sp.]
MAPLVSNPPSRSKPGRQVAASWRALTGGASARDHDRRTLIACSGGADSSALAIVLASSSPRAVVLGHVVHDLRQALEANADRDKARQLADRLGVGFCESAVQVAASPGNAEANARDARYRALAAMASSHGCPFIATGHQGDDQVETMLMAAARGAGLAGLSGIEPVRPLTGTVTLVRPMLGISRQDAETICDRFGWRPASDATNTDRTRTRAMFRHGVLAELRSSAPSLAGRLADTASLLREAHAIVEHQANKLSDHATMGDGAVSWPRACFDGRSWLVVATHLRSTHAELTRGIHADSLSMRVVEPVARALTSGHADTLRREFQWRGVLVTIEAERVDMRLTTAHTRRTL